MALKLIIQQNVQQKTQLPHYHWTKHTIQLLP